MQIENIHHLLMDEIRKQIDYILLIKPNECNRIVDSFSEFKDKDIDRVTMMRIVEDVFRSTLKENMDQTKMSMLLLILIKEI